ncbi:MAG: glucans biosynthesis glucosyltransferase MdoH [Pseudomonadota bacterium]
MSTPMMPAKAPLPMRAQTFRQAPEAVRPNHGGGRSSLLWRLGAFGPAILITLSLLDGLWRWFATGGVTWGEAMAVVLIGVTFIWVSLSVSAVLIAALRLAFKPSPEARPGPGAETVALLVPVHNENPSEVLGNVAAMRAELAQGPGPDRFAFFILSDTTDDAVAEAEARAIAHVQATSAPGDAPVYYRRRPANTDRKIGNLNDWISDWGGAWDAMIVLDADSLMSGAAIRHLADAMAADPDAGLIQSFPVLISAETLFGRMQEFATSVYGWLLAEGLALWSQSEGNYWGHNAIIRTRAFADSARLPYMRGAGGRETLILSHDFVEAGMLRRAGWAVRFLPRAGGSFEETPPTLIDYILRDRRWCRGNMQHLRLLGIRGFHPISRFHLLQGAVAYLLSPAWFALLVIWSAFLPMAEAAAPESYFSPANPLFPVWPSVSQIDGVWFLALIYAMLLLPKVIAATLLAMRGVARLYGGLLPFLATTLVEIVLAILYAPILMVQQTGAVIRAIFGRAPAWLPQRRSQGTYGWAAIWRFHWAEVVLGTGLFVGLGVGVLSAWLTPIALSLLGAPLLSKLSGARLGGVRMTPFRLESPVSLRAPRVARTARTERERLAIMLADSAQIAAE